MSEVLPIRRQVDRELSLPMTDEEWDVLQDEVLIPAWGDEQFSSSELAKKVQRLRGAFGGRRQVRQGRPIRQRAILPASGVREQKLAALLAATAADEAAVQAFRRDILSNALLPGEEVVAFLLEQRRSGGTELWLTDAWIPPSEQGKIADAMNEKYEAALLEHEAVPPTFTDEAVPMPVRVIVDAAHLDRHLAYREVRCAVPNPKTGGTDVVSFATGRGVLERLRQLGEQLAATYGWDEADAVRFVLTGEPPRMPAITAQLQIDEQTPTRSRITLTIDPTVLPAKVAEHYRHVRKQVLGRRYRELSEKHLELAGFAAARPQGGTVAQRMAAWNEAVSAEHPQWTYILDRNFARDTNEAIAHLLRPDLHQPPDDAEWPE